MSKLTQTVLASLVLVAALVVGIFFQNNILLVDILKGILLLIEMIGLLINYGYIKVNAFRHEHIKKVYWVTYCSVVLFFLLSGNRK